MLVQALLQTSLILWLAQQTLQGGIRPQSVSWGRVMPARGVGIGVKPGVAGALGALGSRYGSKAMKTGIGHYPVAQQPGVGGYRALGLGGRAGLKQGGYGPQGAYGANLGTGMGLGAGLTNGLGLGQGGRRVHGAGAGAGAGTLPGYGALAGIGYHGARPGVSAADLGGSETAALGQAVQDLKRAKSRALDSLFLGKQDRTLGPEMPNMRRSSILGPTGPELQAETGFRPAILLPGTQVKSLDPLVKSSSLGPVTFLDKQSKSLGLAVSSERGGEMYEPTVSKRKSTASHGATLATGGARQQQPVDEDIRNLGSARDYDSSIQQSQKAKNCGSTRDLSDRLEMEKYRELLASEAQRTQSLVPQPHVGMDSKHRGRATPQAQGEETYLLSQSQDARTNIFSLPPGQRTRIYLSAAVNSRQGIEHRGLAGKDSDRLRIHGTVALENHKHGSANPQVQRVESNVPVIPGASGTKSLGIASAGRQEAKGLFHAEHDVRESKALDIPEQTMRNTQGTSFIGGAGNYPGASLGPGGYGAGLGQGAYLGGAAGKAAAAAALGQGGYPHGAAGKSNGYGEGATGYLGAAAGNGFGYGNGNGNGNGYGDGYGAGLGYPSELTDDAENKARKSQGGYAGQPQGAYGALGAGLESTAGKYGGGAAQVPYGGAPVIPTGLEGDGGYPYSAQQLSLGGEGAKTTNKHGTGAGYGVQQTGYGAQLGATQDALGEHAGKYGGANGAHGNGYKG